MNYLDFSALNGLTLRNVTVSPDRKRIDFETDSGRRFALWHEQDCCESVLVEDVAGDLSDLIGEPLLLAEEVSNSTDPAKDEYTESYTWTYYKLATIKGSVSVRWYGSSNGYYSESVSFGEIQP